MLIYALCYAGEHVGSCWACGLIPFCVMLLSSMLVSADKHIRSAEPSTIVVLCVIRLADAPSYVLAKRIGTLDMMTLPHGRFHYASSAHLTLVTHMTLNTHLTLVTHWTLVTHLTLVVHLDPLWTLTCGIAVSLGSVVNSAPVHGLLPLWMHDQS